MRIEWSGMLGTAQRKKSEAQPPDVHFSQLETSRVSISSTLMRCKYHSIHIAVPVSMSPLISLLEKQNYIMKWKKTGFRKPGWGFIKYLLPIWLTKKKM